MSIAAGLLIEGPRQVSLHHALRGNSRPWWRTLTRAGRPGAAERALNAIH
ncbi:MAG TPA: hypothetical protein VFG59_07330 [Anaeromyxobacter sp.]|nr:hypothetical protein [Anaeromyxobacter sp.]